MSVNKTGKYGCIVLLIGLAIYAVVIWFMGG